MKHTFFVSLFMLCSLVLPSQNIERKIIIDGGKFYFTTIDDETQVATLYCGNDTSKISQAKKLAVPAGRNFSDPINPFCWDVSAGNLFAVNFMMHPLNDRNESIKRFPLSFLKEWTPETKAMELIMVGVDYTPYAYNDPYLFITKRSNTMDHFFFDAIAVNDTNYCMAIANNGELSIWNYNGKIWKQGPIVNFPVENYFSLFVCGDKTYLATTAGGVYEVSSKGIVALKNKSVGSNLTNCILVINKDDKSVSYLKRSDFKEHTSMNDLIKQKAIRIFNP